MIKTMTELGIQHISMRTDKDGLLLGVNDKPLPSIVWNDQYLNNGAELFTALNTYAWYGRCEQDGEAVVAEPAAGEHQLALRFPLAPGAQKLQSSVVPYL